MDGMQVTCASQTAFSFDRKFSRQYIPMRPVFSSEELSIAQSLKSPLPSDPIQADVSLSSHRLRGMASLVQCKPEAILALFFNSPRNL